MAKKGIVEKTVRAAVSAAKEALAPSPLAKQLIAAAAAQAISVAEARARQALPELEKAMKKKVGDRVVKPVDAMLTDEQPASKRRGGAKTKRRKSARGAAASRKSGRKKTARSRSAAKTGRKRARKMARGKAKRR
jgi:hypothetical protein